MVKLQVRQLVGWGSCWGGDQDHVPAITTLEFFGKQNWGARCLAVRKVEADVHGGPDKAKTLALGFLSLTAPLHRPGQGLPAHQSLL